MTQTRKIEKSADAYRSIGEAAEDLGLATHVLRYWETKFGAYIKPLKRRDGRRMFRPADMDALRAIQLLVHNRGLTLKGASNLLDEQGVDSVLNGEARLGPVATSTELTETVTDAEYSPARSLREDVRKAFGAVAEEPTELKGLEATLADLTDIKARLDKLRRAKAA